MADREKKRGKGGRQKSEHLEKKSLKPATLLKKRLWHKCFPFKAKFLRSTFLIDNSSGCFSVELIESVKTEEMNYQVACGYFNYC